MKMEPSRRDALKLGSATFLGLGTAATAWPEVHPVAAATRSHDDHIFRQAFGNGQYQLPPLPYEYDALEPAYDEQTLRIHHDKHHAGYVKGLNTTLATLQSAREGGDFAWIEALSRNLAFNGSGHVLHTLFWNSMSPTQADMPDSLARAMEQSFGSVENGRNQFAAATKAVMGSGWGVLVHEPIADRVLVLQAGKHQNLSMWNTTPLLCCDVWEHAYYLQYQNNRGRWVDNFMRIANWPLAAARLAQARGNSGMSAVHPRMMSY